MIVKILCSECNGQYRSRVSLIGWACEDCGKVIVPSDLVDVDEPLTIGGILHTEA